MKKGINIWSFPDQPLGKSFALAKDAGFDGVEVGLLAEGEVSLTSTERDLLAVKQSAKDNGIELYSVATGLYWDHWLTDDLPAERRVAKDIVKKHLHQGHPLDKEKLAKELGDIAWYLAEAATALDMPLEDILQANIDKLKKRYPEGFDSQRSTVRLQGDL